MRKILIVAAVFLLVSPNVIFAAKPDPNVPNPPLQVLEHNVDASGWIAVHEQGTASVDIVDTEELDVNITNSELDVNITNPKLLVDVDNLPTIQDVDVIGGELSPVTQFWTHYFSVTPDEVTQTIMFTSTIYATTINVSDLADETHVYFLSAQSPGANALLYLDGDAAIPFHTDSFTYPIPLEGVKVSCVNESDTCQVHVSVHGF